MAPKRQPAKKVEEPVVEAKKAATKKVTKKAEPEQEEQEEAPVKQVKATKTAASKKETAAPTPAPVPTKKATKSQAKPAEDSDDEDVPEPKTKQAKKAPAASKKAEAEPVKATKKAPAKKAAAKKQESDDEDDEPMKMSDEEEKAPAKKTQAKAKAQSKAPVFPFDDDYNSSDDDDNDSMSFTESDFSELDDVHSDGENSVTMDQFQEVQDLIKITKEKLQKHEQSKQTAKQDTQTAESSKKRKRADGAKPQEKVAEDLSNRGVIYVGHIPFGFFEDQMQGFFTQFGTVTRLRLSRNKKTGRSKHYAFIEFADKDVAAIVAETMNNYMMFGRTLVVQVVPKDKVHDKLFKGANQKFKQVPWNKINRQRHNGERTAEQQQTRINRLLKKEQKKRDQLKKLGIEYDFKGYAGELKASK